MFDFFELELLDGTWVAVAGELTGNVLTVTLLAELDGDNRREITGAELRQWVAIHGPWLKEEVKEHLWHEWADGVLDSQMVC